MLVIGLTGGIGSGKSTVAHLFAKHGVTIIDADQLARDITLPGTLALEKIKHRYGDSILHADQTLNRPRLREIIFEHPEERRWLEELLHPLIRTNMAEVVQATTSPYCIAVIPLLLETSPNPIINRILVVNAPETLQIKRTMLRDNLTEEAVRIILKSQVTQAKRLAAADDVLENNGTPQDLEHQVEKLHRFYLSLSKV